MGGGKTPEKASKSWLTSALQHQLSGHNNNKNNSHHYTDPGDSSASFPLPATPALTLCT